jgi:hypothetical protein
MRVRTASNVSSAASLNNGSSRLVKAEAISVQSSGSNALEEITIFHHDVAALVLYEVANDVVDVLPENCTRPRTAVLRVYPVCS